MTLFKSLLIIIKSLLFFIFDSITLLLIRYPKQKNKNLVLLIRQDAIGDFIIWLDTAKEFRNLYPSGKYKIVLVGNAIWCDLAKALPYWDEVIPVDTKQFKTISSYRWDLIKQIRNLGAQISIQPTFSREFYHGDTLVRASGSPRRVSSEGDMSNRNWLKKTLADSWHTELIPASNEMMTELERNAEFFRGLSKKPHFISYPKLNLPESESSVKWEDKEYYVLFPGVSEALRQWPVECFAEIANRIFDQTGLTGILDGAPNEKLLGESIQKMSRAPLEWAGTTLDELPKLFRYAKFIVSGETGAVCIAAALDTAVICILGGAYFGRFFPFPRLSGQENMIQTVSYPMTCYKCNADCKFELRKDEAAPCVYNISVDSVWKKVKPLLKN